jgi:serine phosphatase RsbU (regulator of sigma subunit)
LFFTDGLPDAFDAEDENFGLERLQAVCAAQAERAAAEFLGKICGSEQICRRAS